MVRQFYYLQSDGLDPHWSDVIDRGVESPCCHVIVVAMHRVIEVLVHQKPYLVVPLPYFRSIRPDPSHQDRHPVCP